MYPINYTKSYNNIQFGVFHNIVNDKDGRFKYRGDTQVCRDGLYFVKMADYINQKYKSVPKVNVIVHACSDGEEAYSLAGILKARYGKNANKFFPIKAKDIDADYLEIAQKGIYTVGKEEAEMANACMDGMFNFYFIPILPKRCEIPDYLYRYYMSEGTFHPKVKISDSLRNLVKFEQGDILDDAKKINFKNTVFFARNCWPYLTEEKQNKLAAVLSKRMDESSTLIIGEYDKFYHVDEILKKYGFVEVKDIIFEKAANGAKLYDYEYNSIYKK